MSLVIDIVILYFSVVADCGQLSDPTDGQVTFEPAGTTVFNSRATYSCNSGFSLQGDQTRDCQADETWSGSEPKCVRKSKKLKVLESK